MREDVVRKVSSTVQDAVEIRQVGLVPFSNLLTDTSREIAGLGESERRLFSWSELSFIEHELLNIESALHL